MLCYIMLRYDVLYHFISNRIKLLRGRREIKATEYCNMMLDDSKLC